MSPELQKTIRRKFEYQPSTGLFVYMEGKRAGESTKGTLNNKLGYYVFHVNSKVVYAHRMAFVLMNEPLPVVVDHKDRNGQNNKWGNLRASSYEQNAKNAGPSKTSRFKVRGVDFCKALGKWRARIWEEKQEKHLGLFDTLFDAVCSRKSAELKDPSYQ